MDKRRKAAALRYDAEKDQAPRLTAKGGGLIAEKIIHLARTHGIPIKEDPDLLEVLIQLDWHEHIPPPPLPGSGRDSCLRLPVEPGEIGNNFPLTVLKGQNGYFGQ